MAHNNISLHPNDKIVWVDCETTGTNTVNEQPDQLLEIAILVTDRDLNLLDDTGLNLVVKHNNANELRERSHPVVQTMHDTTGLWDKLATGTPLADVDQEAYEYVRQFAPQPRTAYFAGNSLRLDMNVIERFLPTLSQHAHYRSLDITSLQIGLGLMASGVPDKPHTVNEHTAMADIRASLNQMRALRAFVQTITR